MLSMIVIVQEGLSTEAQWLHLVLKWRKGIYSLAGGKCDCAGLKETWYALLCRWIEASSWWHKSLVLNWLEVLFLCPLSSPCLHIFTLHTNYLLPRTHRLFWFHGAGKNPVGICCISFNLSIYMHFYFKIRPIPDTDRWQTHIYPLSA